MKIKFSDLLTPLSIAFLLLLCLPAFAQEGEDPSNDIEIPTNDFQDPNQLNLTEDKPLIYDDDKSNPVKVVETPSKIVNAPLHPAKAKTTDDPTTNKTEEKDALSFNFLYYIIQKYKISDIIDQ